MYKKIILYQKNLYVYPHCNFPVSFSEHYKTEARSHV